MTAPETEDWARRLVDYVTSTDRADAVAEVERTLEKARVEGAARMRDRAADVADDTDIVTFWGIYREQDDAPATLMAAAEAIRALDPAAVAKGEE